MTPTMTGPHTAIAEIAKITAMLAHDQQSLSGDTASGLVAGGLFVLAFTWRAFAFLWEVRVTGAWCGPSRVRRFAAVGALAPRP